MKKQRRFDGSKLKAARIKAGLQQWKLAQLAGVTQSNVCTWENGDSVPGADAAYRLCGALGVAFDSLFTELQTK